MKKVLIGLLFVAGTVSIAKAACVLGNAVCVDDKGNVTIAGQLVSGNGSSIPTASSTTIVGQNASNTGITALQSGQEILCTNCIGQGGTSTNPQVCISTAANASSWVLVSSTPVSCK